MANQNSKNKSNTKTNNKKNNVKGKETNSKAKTTASSKASTNSKKVAENTNKKATSEVNTIKKEKTATKNIAKEKKSKPVESTPVVEETKKAGKKINLTSKQKDLILILLVVILLVVALLTTGDKTPKLDIELPIAVEGEAGFTEISYSEYESKMAEEKPFLVIIVRDGCGYCEMYEPIVEEVSNEYQVPIYYINLANLTEEEQSLLAKSNTYLKTKEWGTPTTLFMYGKTVVDSISGYVEKEEFVEFIKENIKVDENAE